ncbi:hypothetical protein BAUCODRAFT_60097, partial [Baudoinia panamericana UAMH 10762]
APNRLHPSASQPPTPRRPTSKRAPSSVAPHRGQEFSVDDDPDEVDHDLRLARTQTTENRQRDSRPPALHTVESDEREEQANGEPSSEETLQGEEEEEEDALTPENDNIEDEDDVEDDDDADLSDAESFTLKDRQKAINETHPFGIRIWKPALYKKNRSVQRNAEGDIHSAPGGRVSRWLFIFNCLWTIVFGWWLALLAGLGGIINLLLAFLLRWQSCREYGRVLINLSHYLFYPFGKYVKLERDEAYLEEDEGEGRSISEYERWQTGDLEEGRLFFGPADINRSIIGRRRDEVPDLEPPAEETDSLLGRSRGRQSSAAQRARTKTKKRLFGRGKWNFGRVIFFLSFYLLITPSLFLVSGICWFLVFTIPMGKVTLLLFYHLRRHPLALSFHTDSHYARGSTQTSGKGGKGSSILLCTYRAVGLKYWKYTIDGTNIFLINLLGLVVFAIFDYFILYSALGIRTWLTAPGFVFVLALASIIPLAYFIGQAVASISAQSSMGVGATINAFFSTVVEVFLYCVALKEGKAQLVEGSIIGSIFAGILFLPGISMCFGALKRKTQRFNVKSAGVTSTMLLFAVIGAFGPTLFYQIYGSHELLCHQCTDNGPPDDTDLDRDCRRCYFAQVPAVHDPFFTQAVRPYIWFASVCLFLSYVVGLLFTLRTHAAVIWNNEPDEKREGGKVDEAHSQKHHSITSLSMLSPQHIRESQLYKRIYSQSIRQAGYGTQGQPKKDAPPGPGVEDGGKADQQTPPPPHLVPPKSAPHHDAAETGSVKSVRTTIHGLSPEDNRALVQQMSEIAATAATVAARDATRAPKKAALMASVPSSVRIPQHKDSKEGLRKGDHPNATENAPSTPMDTAHPTLVPTTTAEKEAPAAGAGEGGHDAPNWSRTKSAIILLTATLAYAIIAEILVDTVDAVLSGISLSQKFLGLTLFALVPNTTEFLNAISFAMNGNVALSMEIGSSYALQVMLLQIPCLVLFSAVYGRFIDEEDVIDHTFTLIFPQWDMVTVILGVFLMGWVVGEGKSNYFKGSTLILTYLVITVGFWFSGYGDSDTMGINRFDTLALGSVRGETFRTVGRPRSGMAF